MNDAIKYAGEFMLGLITLAMIAVLVIHSGGTSQIVQSTSSGGANLLSTAMGNSGGGMFNFSGAQMLPNAGFNISGMGG